MGLGPALESIFHIGAKDIGGLILQIACNLVKSDEIAGNCNLLRSGQSAYFCRIDCCLLENVLGTKFFFVGTVSACNPEVSNVIMKAVDDAIAMVSKVPLCSYFFLIIVNAFEVCLQCSKVISDGTYPVGSL